MKHNFQQTELPVEAKRSAIARQQMMQFCLKYAADSLLPCGSDQAALGQSWYVAPIILRLDDTIQSTL